MKSRIAIVAALALVIGGCQQAKKAAAPAAKPTLVALDGYAGMKFGMSFNEALATASPYEFNGAAVKGCLVELAIRGCLLSAGDNLRPYQTEDGIPYGLKLAFNRHDKLTDISLTYDRDSVLDSDQRISKADCRSINDRTVDWVVGKFGQLGPLGKSGKMPNTRTDKGNAFYLDDEGKNFFVFGERALANGRAVTLFNHYLVIGGDTTCSIQVSFEEPDSVERWSMSPEEKADLERVGKEADAASSDETDSAPMDNDSEDAATPDATSGEDAISGEEEGQWGD